MPTFAAAIVPRFVRKRRSSAVPSVVEAGVIAILKQFEKLYTHMPLFTPYFSLDSSAYRVGNGGRLRCHMGAAGIGIYVMLLSHLRDCRDYRAPLDYDLLAFDLHEDADAVRRVVEEFDLFDIDRASGTFTSSALDAVRALGTSDSPSSGRTSTRTGRVRRVRTAAQAYRRSVRRLAADNALPPDADDDIDETDSTPTEELGTPPADCATAENDFTTAEEGNAPLAEIDSTPAEDEETSPADAPRSAAEPAPTANENAPSPRTEEKRGEQKKIPHTPIVPFPPSGKGTRASHSSAPVVEEEEGASEAEVEGAVPTVADTSIAPAEKEPKTSPADSPTAEIESAPADASTPHGETDTTQATTSADAPDTRRPHGETNTEQATTSATHPNTEAPHGENDTTQATTSAAHPDTRTPRGETDTTQATISADAPNTHTPHGETDTTQAALNTETAKPAPLNTQPTDDARGADAEDGETFVPPTANEVRRFAQALHHPEFDAEWFVHYYTARHWQRHNGHPVRSWQTTARYWLTHPLQVAQHLLRHRPAPGAAPAGTSVQLSGVSPSSAGTSPSSAGIISTTGSTNLSSVSPGAAPAGTRPSSPASGVPLGGSLSLPAPTPLQQSRLCDLRHMVHHLFADAPAAAPASVSTVPDAPAAASTPVPSVPTSAPSPRVLSPAEAAHFIEAQTLSAADAEEEARACEISAADAKEEARAYKISTADTEKEELNGDERDPDDEESIDAQALPTDPAEKENRACELSTTDNEEGEPNCDELSSDAKESIEAQEFSTDKAEEGTHAHEISTTDAEEDDSNCDKSNPDGEESIEAQEFPTDRREEEKRACELSTTDNEKDDGNNDELDPDAKGSMDTQALGTDPAEEEKRACELSTTDNEKGIDTQAFSTTDIEEENRTCEISTANGEESTDTQAISTTKERFSTRSPHGPAPPTGDEATATAARHRLPPHTTEKNPFPLNLNHDAPPILPLHPPAPVGLGCTLRVQSAQPPFGRSLLGHIDLGRAPRPAGSRPLRPQPAEDRRASPEHVPLGGTHEPKTADFIDNSVADEPQRRDFAAKRHLDAPFCGIHEPKTADFIDYSTADEPQRRPDAGEHSADEHNAPADQHPRHPDASELPADEHNAPADEFDAGQRLLDTAAHRRAVRAELAACCGALRHLAHCCVAF